MDYSTPCHRITQNKSADDTPPAVNPSNTGKINQECQHAKRNIPFQLLRTFKWFEDKALLCVLFNWSK